MLAAEVAPARPANGQTGEGAQRPLARDEERNERKLIRVTGLDVARGRPARLRCDNHRLLRAAVPRSGPRYLPFGRPLFTHSRRSKIDFRSSRPGAPIMPIGFLAANRTDRPAPFAQALDRPVFRRRARTCPSR